MHFFPIYLNQVLGRRTLLKTKQNSSKFLDKLGPNKYAPTKIFRIKKLWSVSHPRHMFLTGSHCSVSKKEIIKNQIGEKRSSYLKLTFSYS